MKFKSNAAYKKWLAKYKKGGLKYQTGGGKYQGRDMYGANVIPNAYTPSNASINYLQTDPAVTESLLQQQEELGTEADLSEMEANAAKRKQTGESVMPTLESITKSADKAGLFGASVASAPDLTGTVAEKMSYNAPIPGVDQGLGATGQTAAQAGTLNAGVQAYRGAKTAGQTTKTALQVGSTAAGWAGPQAVGTAASMIGKGIEKASDDEDATTMNVGETSGKLLKGAGYGATAAGIAGGLGAFGATMSWNPIGWAALAGAGIAGGVGLLQRRRARKDEGEATSKFDRKQNRIAKKLAKEEEKGLTYAGYDFGNPDATVMGSERYQQKTGGVRKYKGGGAQVPGGVVQPIPGSDAVEFKGKSHEEGGILLDKNTEVENGETMDKVTMKGKGKKDYFFSNYLKVGGKTFADKHKDMLRTGATQREINLLAKAQEGAANRNPEAVQVAATGGARQYQMGNWWETQDPNISVPEQVQSYNIDPNQVNTIDQNITTEGLLNTGDSEVELTGTPGGTPTKSKTLLQKLKEGVKNSNIDVLSLGASAAQMLPALKAMKDTPDYMNPAGRVSKTKLDRVNYNAARSSNTANARTMSKAIENSGAGPGSIAAKMANYAAARKQDLAISAAEGTANTQIANAEAGLNQRSNMQNIANTMAVDEFNAGADAATKDRKLEALSAMTTNLAGMNRDRLMYKADNVKTAAISGDSGVSNRLDLRLRAAKSAGATSGPEFEAAYQALLKEQGLYMYGGVRNLKRKK
jgi:hypothetical protein